MTEFNSLVLAAYLHDVGKIIQRVDRRRDGESRWHPLLGRNWFLENGHVFKDLVDIELVANLILYHHENPGENYRQYSTGNAPKEISTLARIVDKADSYSSMERLPATDRNPSAFRRLLWVPSVLMSEGEFKEGKYLKYQFDQVAVDDQDSEPAENLNPLLWKTVESELLSGVPKSNFYSCLNHIDCVFKKYASRFPSQQENRFRDISLYDHSRTTAGIAAAMYKNNGGLFRMIAVELAGVEEFIFSVNMEKAMKKLKSRKVYCDSLFDEFIRGLLEIYGLPALNALIRYPYSAYLLVQGDADLYAKALNLRRETNLKLLKDCLKYRMSSCTFDESGFGNINAVIKRATDLLNEDAPYRDVFVAPGNKWREFVVDVRQEEIIIPDLKPNDVINRYPLLGYAAFDSDSTKTVVFDGFSKITVDGNGVSRSISRIFSVSDKINAFFEKMYGDAQEEKIHPIYRSGQSLIIVGKWDSVFDFVGKAHKNFGKYFSNEKITMSASVVVVHNKTPFLLVVDHLNKLLKSVKRKGGNKIAVWERFVEWNNWEYAVECGKRLSDLLSNREISRSFLYDLLQCELKMYDCDNPEDLPVILAHIARLPGSAEIKTELEENLNFKSMWLSVQYALTDTKQERVI